MIIYNMYETKSKKFTQWCEKNSPKLYEKYIIDFMNRVRDLKYKDLISDVIKEFYISKPLFQHVEIETINRCNNICSFCPVNKHVDSRIYKKMDENLFYKIIDELKELNYSSTLTFHSNNEPLLDERISDFIIYARKNLPNAKLIIFTNGTLLTKDIFKILIENLDEIVIDNYHDELKLIKPVKDIYDLCLNDKTLYDLAIKKLKIDLRKQNEILTSRGGTSPNRKNSYTLKSSCILPFRQMIIRPDGKISLCCNDPLGKFTLGDVNAQSLVDIWYGDKFNNIRDLLKDGRYKISICKTCDTILV